MTPEQMQTRLTECGIQLPAAPCEQLTQYHALLLEWNERMDLTAVTDETDMLDRHYVDSLSPLLFPGLIPEDASLIDVGTGAGFPGLPLAIARPDLRVTLLDSQRKRLRFLQAVVDALGLTNVTLHHARAEDAGHVPTLREQFDLATARAVAPLAVLAEYLLPFVHVAGKALCWKGPALAEEINAGRRAAFLMGGSEGEHLPVTFPGRDWQHNLQVLKKERLTPHMYPRKAGTPAKAPLA